MKYAAVAFTLVSATLLTGCGTIKETHFLQQQTLQSVEAIRTDVTELVRQKTNDEAAALAEKQKQQKLKALRALVSEHIASRTDFEAFLDINLPENPSDDQVRDYITAVLNADSKQRSYGQQELQVVLLSKLGRERIPLLLEQLPKYYTGNQYAATSNLRYAIRNLADDSCHELIKDAILNTPQNHQGNMMELLKNLQLGPQDKEFFITLLNDQKNSSNSYINYTLIETAAGLNDPEINQILINLVIQSSNLQYNLKRLKSTEGFNMRETMKEAWKYRAGMSSQDQLYAAQYAALNGEAFALDLLVSALTPGSKALKNAQFDPYFALLAAIDFRGTDKEIQDWYEQNKNNLIFDKESGRFTVRAEEPTAEVTAAAPAE